MYISYVEIIKTFKNGGDITWSQRENGPKRGYQNSSIEYIGEQNLPKLSQNPNFLNYLQGNLVTVTTWDLIPTCRCFKNMVHFIVCRMVFGWQLESLSEVGRWMILLSWIPQCRPETQRNSLWISFSDPQTLTQFATLDDRQHDWTDCMPWDE